MDFRDGGHGGHLGFSIETNLAIFDLQVTLVLPTKFQVVRPFRSGEEAKSQLAQGCRRSRLLKLIVDAARRTTDAGH